MLFFKHLWLWLIAMLFFVFSVPILPSNHWFSVDAELDANARFYGKSANEQFVSNARTRFEKWFVQSGFYDASIKLTRPAKPIDQARANRELVTPNMPWFATYVDQAWDGVMRALYRWEVNTHWYLASVISLFVGLNDGLVRRSLRPATTHYVSPVQFHLVGHFLLANVIGALLVLPWLPIVMHWWMWMIAIAVLTKFWSMSVASMPSMSTQRLQ